jgi:hypothetical protein
MRRPIAEQLSRFLLIALAFSVIAAVILSQPSKALKDFDQPFYITIAYDLDRYGVFSNGIFDTAASPATAPQPGMFFVPGYPLLVLATMKLDRRFAAAVKCTVEADRARTENAPCEAYATSLLIVHAILLALATFAIALCGELMFGGACMFWLTGLLATAAFAFEGDIFSFVMTESLTVFLYSLLMLCVTLACLTWRTAYACAAGLMLGLLCLTRPSFVVLVPIILLLVVIKGRFDGRPVAGKLLILAACYGLVLVPWIVRNHVSVGKWGLTEEYGAAVLIERFAYNDMTPYEYVLAFPFCTPGLGDIAFDQVHGRDSMHRFVYHTAGSFFHVGRGRRDMLVKEHGQLDPVIGGIVRAEMRSDWWRHLLVSIPLGWCGLWVGWLWGLLTIPLFVLASVRAVRQRQPMLLLYAAPAVAMVGLHALVANHYTRYNLILIGPLAVAAAWIMSGCWTARWRARAPAPGR